MLFTNVTPSPYDVRFMLLGFPVRITPLFWAMSVFLGRGRELDLAAVWVAAVLVSILVHELGHAVLQRAFGGTAEIVLYAFGGYASAHGVRDAWWRQVLISLAGPGAGFLLAAAVFGVISAFGEPGTRVARVFVSDLLWINIWWGVINLAPVWPLDGGRIAREVLVLVMKPSNGIVASLILSTVTATALAIYRYQQTGSLWSVALFGLLAYQSYESLQKYRASRGGW